MIVRPFLHPDTGGISYLFGCGGKATGAVVEPVADRGACPRVAAG
ncbi:hypothetical protein [Burkholderia sp. Ac-20345]|nr:hypothetical protein [Burkholderia sp. Ac-20345]